MLITEVRASRKAIGVVIWLHGLGASGSDFVPIVPHLQLPDVDFLFPEAPVRPVTINGGFEMPAWYDITTFEQIPEREHPPHIAEASKMIREVISKEVERGIPSEQIVLMGFSQGAALALHVGRAHPEKLAGIAVLSGYELLSEQRRFESRANCHTPILFCHGVRDLVVPLRRGESAYDSLSEDFSGLEWREYPVGHEICLEELRHIRFWLHARFNQIRRQLHEGEDLSSKD